MILLATLLVITLIHSCDSSILNGDKRIHMANSTMSLELEQLLHPNCNNKVPFGLKEAIASIKNLQDWYNPETGLWSIPIFQTEWWSSAIALESWINLAELIRLNKKSQAHQFVTKAEHIVHNLFSHQHENRFVPPLLYSYDDSLWWGISWLRAYEVFRKPIYLDRAVLIYEQLKKHAWDPKSCNGGLWWDSRKTYKNAITTELFITLAARLAATTREQKYLDMAVAVFRWLARSGMQNSHSHLINDGLDDCRNNGQTTWTYNQGVILSGCAYLYALTKDAGVLSYGIKIAEAVEQYLTYEKPSILREPCEKKTSSGKLHTCNKDQSLFKGIYMNHLWKLLAASRNTKLSIHRKWKEIVKKNALVMLKNSEFDEYYFDTIWLGPFEKRNPSSQIAAVQTLTTAAIIEMIT